MLAFCMKRIVFLSYVPFLRGQANPALVCIPTLGLEPVKRSSPLRRDLAVYLDAQIQSKRCLGTASRALLCRWHPTAVPEGQQQQHLPWKQTTLRLQVQ